MYAILKPLLFLLDPERAHACALSVLEYLPTVCFRATKHCPVHAMGLTFAHRLGLAAGFDKSGAYVNALAKLGFAFIEVGTVTPRPQSGQIKPRLFRLPQAAALINRMGFNNPGVDRVVANLRQSNYHGILGLNIGKSRDTSLNLAADDYLYCLEKVYAHASYVAINVSSPNTPELRQLQASGYFANLMQKLRTTQLRLADQHGRYVPLLVKVSPDEAEDSLQQMAEVMLKQRIDGIIATNTTCARDGVSSMPHGMEPGGLSGKPLLSRATRCLRILKEIVGQELTLIGVGGIDSLASAQEKLAAGATLLQVYTGLIYRGPGLISELSGAEPRGINELP